jgi:hypothetical protein
MIGPFQSRRMLFGAARRYLLDSVSRSKEPEVEDQPPRLTPKAIEKTRMFRTREKILTNLEEMYREAFDRAKDSGDEKQLVSLDFAYRREQLYFEILLDIREAMGRRG